METARKVYTAEYYDYNYAPETQGERIRRTRQRPETDRKNSSKKKYIRPQFFAAL